MKYFYDLHIHSCLSPCGDADMTPNNIVNMSRLKGLDIIAVTDHNSAGNVAAVMTCGQQAGVLVVPGMEIETSEEVHVLAFFPSLDKCLQMDSMITAAMPQLENREEIFGAQHLLNERDEYVGSVSRMLVTAGKLSIEEVARHAQILGGVTVPAHVDRSSYSVLSNLGFIPPEPGFTCVEISKNTDRDHAIRRYPFLSDYHILSSSDAHYLADISEPQQTLDLPQLSAEAVVSFLKTHRTGINDI